MASLCAGLLAIPIILACGAPPVTITTAPASDLTLEITIDNQDGTMPQVAVGVRIQLTHQSPPYVLSAAHLLTCDGIAVPINSGAALVPRQPPDGAYTFVYTDERGQRTTLVVPVPSGRFALRAPTEGAHVTLPRQPSLIATPNSEITPSTTGPGSTSVVSTRLPPTPTGQIRDPGLVSQPPVMIRYTVPASPTGAQTVFQVRADCGGYGRPDCGTVIGPTLAATGLYPLSDVGMVWGSGFETFTPGTGDLAISFATAWSAPPSGFSAVHLTFADQAVLHINWT